MVIKELEYEHRRSAVSISFAVADILARVSRRKRGCLVVEATSVESDIGLVMFSLFYLFLFYHHRNLQFFLYIFFSRFSLFEYLKIELETLSPEYDSNLIISTYNLLIV